VRLALIAAVAAVGLAACGSSRSVDRADKCADLMLRLAPEQRDKVPKAIARDYVLRAYCRRFAKNGWVYADGAMSIDAQKWLVRGYRCATSASSGRTMTVPCEVVQSGMMDCAMLHYVRRSEARAYVSELDRRGPVACDDGTTPRELGVP
jgi:hypothetical protein